MKLKYILGPLLILLLPSCSTVKPKYSWAKYTKSNFVKKRNVAANVRSERLHSVEPESLKIQDLSSRENLEFLVFGDSGTGEKDQYKVAEKMNEVCSTTETGKCDFALLLGDTIYPNGLESSNANKISEKDYVQLKNKFERPYEKLKDMDIWVVPGNHEWRGDIQAMINYSKESRLWKMPYNHYKIPLLPDWLHIYGLDTTRINRLYDFEKGHKDQLKKKRPNYKGTFGNQDAKSELCHKDGWKILFGHHGIYTKGPHGFIDNGNTRNLLRNINVFKRKEFIKKMSDSLRPLIKECGVKVLFSGHDHHQEHTEGYYSRKKKKVLFHQIIQGSAGKLRRVMNSRIKPHVKKTKFAKSLFGFSLVKVNRETMKIEFYGYSKGQLALFKKHYEFEISLKEKH